MAVSELLIALALFLGMPAMIVLWGLWTQWGREPPPPEPLYRPQDWGSQDYVRRKQ